MQNKQGKGADEVELTPIFNFNWRENNMALQTLTCLNHPDLRWMTKHPGERTLHYIGDVHDETGAFTPECSCPLGALLVIGKADMP